MESPDDPIRDRTSDDIGGAPEALVGLAKGSTLLFVLVQVVAAAVPEGVPLAMSVLVSLVLFVLGCFAFLVGFGSAVSRSRDEEITLGGLVFLSGTAPVPIRRVFMACLAAQVAVAVAAAAVRPFTPVAFGILTPMWGIGLMTSWGGRYGEFGAVQVRGEEPADAEAARSDTTDISGERHVKQRPVRPDPLEEIDDFDRLFSGRRERRRSKRRSGQE